jgi:hypothetical protein
MEAEDEPPEAELAALHAVLVEAKKFTSVKTILDVAKKAGRGKPFSGRSLGAFIRGETKSISKENYDRLAAGWLHTPLTRALRNLNVRGELPVFDQLTGILAKGNAQRPSGLAVSGSYFMYHGSYLWPDSYVIRVITIDAKDDQVLTVTDTIRDERTPAEARSRVATGVMIFVEERPQILLWGKENKRGLSLIIGSETDDGHGKSLDQMSGSLIVMPQRGQAASRYFVMIREPEGVPREMIAQSGIFTAADLSEPARAKHHRAFVLLNRFASADAGVDPILAYGNHPARSVK